jgi:hypothetical protein
VLTGLLCWLPTSFPQAQVVIGSTGVLGTSFQGQAAAVSGVAAGSAVSVADAGALAATGGAQEASAMEVSVAGGISVGLCHTAVIGQENVTSTKLLLEARNGVVLLGKGEKIVGQILSVGKKAVDFVAYNRLTGRYILTEAKTTLQAKHLVDLELKAQSTIQAIEKVEQAATGSTAAVEEISITYSSIKASGLGPYSIDAVGNVLKNGAPRIVNGIKVIAIKVVP